MKLFHILYCCAAVLTVTTNAGISWSAEQSPTTDYVEVPVPVAKESQSASADPVVASGSVEGWLPHADLTSNEDRPVDLPGPVLTLREALERAPRENPTLASFDYETRAAEARGLQGGIKPSLEFEAEVSQFLGTAEMRFFRSAETSVGLSQLIERCEKRRARMEVAAREGDLVGFEKRRARLDLMLAVTRAYYKVLIAQEELKLAAEREALTQQVYDVVALKVEAGKSAKLALSRVKVDQASAQIERDQAQRQFENARKSLAAQWGAAEPDFGSVEGQLALPAEAPSADVLRKLLATAPDLQRWKAEEKLRQAKLDLAMADGVPDLTVNGGVARFEDTSSLGLHVGVSVPIHARNRNVGTVYEAQALVEQVSSLRQADLLRMQQELTTAYGDLSAAFERAKRLEAEVLPAAQETFDLTSFGYRYGKFGFLDVLDAERTLLDARRQYVDALADYQLAAVELERLVAQPLNSLTTPETPAAQAAPGVQKEASSHDNH